MEFSRSFLSAIPPVGVSSAELCCVEVSGPSSQLIDPLLLQNTFQRRDTTSSRSSSMELPDDVPHRTPPRHSIDMRGSRHSIDLSRAHSVRPPGAAAAQASTLSRGATSHSDNSAWDSISEENKGIIRQVGGLDSHACGTDVCALAHVTELLVTA